uniref:Ribose-phosphate pyrophosphokinase n=1 Tax=uncultured Armatimonadetes bacterium TaxID=157466 RepID=A0A6J4J5C2_9BACT|nr:Ribose-phosphate pyrophosphokinase [uncultured Armatimonadetes bacterium]
MCQRAPMKLFAGTANPALARAVAEELGIPLGGLEISRFADGELFVSFEESVRGTDVFVLQPTCPPIDANLMEMLVLVDALRRASAHRITCVLPYYGYARQEKKDRPREPITAKLIANLLTTAGADRIVAMDLHADAIPGFFDIPVDHLTTINLISDYLSRKNLSNVVIVSPDEGRVKKIRKIASRLRAPLAVGYKVHPDHGVSEVTHLAGDVRDKTCIVYDDIISTGGSISEVVDALLENGARPGIYVACTHPVLAGPATERLARPEIKELIVTDTIPLPDEKRSPKTTVLSVAALFGQAIHRIWSDESVSSLFVD